MRIRRLIKSKLHSDFDRPGRPCPMLARAPVANSHAKQGQIIMATFGSPHLISTAPAIVSRTALRNFSVERCTPAIGAEITHISVAAAVAIPVFAEVHRSAETQAAGYIIAMAIRLANGKVKAVSQRNGDSALLPIGDRCYAE